jgi:hypothetical protein
MTKMPGEYKYKRKIWTAIGCLGTFGAVYILLFGMTIKNISDYQTSERRISSLTADISKIEFEFLSKEAEINANYAAELGFVEPKTIVIARSVTTPSIALVSK